MRFIQVFDSNGGNNIWDHHQGVNKKLPENCLQTDVYGNVVKEILV